jgi:O-antigen/teichoic acid export membrane protein
MANLTLLIPEGVAVRLRGSATARRVGVNVAWLGLDKVYSTALALVVSIFVARHLGVADFGLFTYALAFVTLLQVPATLGLEEVLVRELVRYPEQRNEILGTSFFLRLFGGVLTMGIVALAVQFARPDDPRARLMVMITSLLYIPQTALVVQRWYSARLLAKYNVLSSNIALTLTSALRLGMVLGNLPLVWFVWSNVALVAINAVAVHVFYAASGEAVIHWRFRWHWCRQLLHDAWPQIPSGIAAAAQNQLGALMIGSMLGDARLGPYAVAYRFYALLVVVPDIVCQSLAPTLTRAKANDQLHYFRRLTQSYRLLFVLYLATLIPILVLGLGGIRLVYGRAFSEAGPLILYFSIPLLLIYVGQLRMWYIIIENQLRYAMWISLAQAAATIVCNYFLIQWFGAIGAIATIAIGALVVFTSDAIFVPARKNLLAVWRAITSFRDD